MPTGTQNSRRYLDVAGYNIPAYERVSSIPSWLPTQGANEEQLMEQYRNTNQMFDSSSFSAASEGQQSRLLTTALSSGNNAAAEYANRARQAGGSGMGAGLVKAQAGTGARAVAGEMELERERFAASQRAAAAGHATQIATTLGQLRDSYLKSLVNYATSEDSTMAGYTASMAGLDAEERRRLGTGGGLTYTYGTGLGRNSSEFSFGSRDEADAYFQRNRGRQTAHGYVPPNYRGG